MARLKNNTEHDINISVIDGDGVLQNVAVPATKEDPEDRTKLLPGYADIDDSLLELARKKYPVVNSYFATGDLTLVARRPAPPASGKS